MAEATRGTVERTVVTHEPSIRLELDESEALTLRTLLFLTQVGDTSVHAANCGSIKNALTDVGVELSEEYRESIMRGEIVKYRSVDTGIYWV